MQLVNTHCHSKYCGHGEGEISEYIAAAKASGVRTLAFTEHFPLTKAFDPDAYLSVPQDKMDDYVCAVESARADEHEMDILLGVELDYLGKDEDREISDDTLDSFDLVLGSVHFIDKWAFDDPAQRDEWEKPGAADRIWRRYIDLWCDLASDTSLHIDVMSHPDLAKKFGYYPTFSLDAEYERMAEAAHAGGRMVEVNTSGAYYACNEMFPAPKLLGKFKKAGVPCTVGTDAHIPRNIGRDIQKAYKLMYDVGYKEVTVPMRERDRAHIAL